MRFALFDEIQETHVVTSLARALRQRGHEVVLTGPIWHGHRFPAAADDKTHVLAALRSCLDQAPDVLFNFRASSLTSDMVAEAATRGVRTQVWLPDDPVLYGICYRHIVDAYDDVLHCGGEEVLDFYERHHGRSGINFPFWTGEQEWPDLAPQEPAATNVVFLGNCDGPVRSARYSIVSSLPFSTRIYGRVPDDPYGIAGGVLDGEYAVAHALSQTTVGLNIPQYFSDYGGTEYDFDELGGLGHFQYPSRVIQFARLGLPMVSLQPTPSEFDEFLAAADRRGLIDTITAMLSDGSAGQRRAAVRERFQRSFSADARAELLERIVRSPDEFLSMSAAERANVFATPLAADADSESAPSRPSLQVSVRTPESRRSGLSGVTTLPVPRRILVLNSAIDDTAADQQVGFARALGHLGHHVLEIDASQPDEVLAAAVDGFEPAAVVTHDLRVVSAAAALDLQQRDIKLVGLVLGETSDEGVLHSDARAFDLIALESPSARIAAIDAGITNTIAIDPAADVALARHVPSTEVLSTGNIICVADLNATRTRARDIDAIRNLFPTTVASPRRASGAGHLSPIATERAAFWQQSQIYVIFASDYGAASGPAAALRDALEAVVCSAGLVCIEQGPGVDELFDDTQAIIFETTDDLVTSLRDVTANPELFTAMSQRAFERVVNGHLYEHRWHSIFESIGLGGAASAEQRDRSKQVVLSGFFGAGNIGDEVILRSLIEGLEVCSPQLQLTIASENPDAVQRSHARPAFLRGDISQADAIMSTSSAVVLGGGGLWHDYSLQSVGGVRSLFDDNSRSITGYAKLPLLAAMQGRPFHVFGIGVGPIEHPAAGPLLNHLASAAADITVRDDHSRDLLTSIEGWEHPVQVEPDVAYALDLGQFELTPHTPSQSNGRPRLVVSLRPWTMTGPDDWVFAVARALQAVVDSHGCDLVGLPMQRGQGSDQWMLERVFAMVETNGAKHVLDWTGDVGETLQVLQSADLVFAMRLHAAILAHRLGRPVIGLSYDEKVANHFADLGIADRVFDLTASANDLSDAMGTTLTSDTEADRIATHVEKAEQQARAAIARLAASLDLAPSVDRTSRLHTDRNTTTQTKTSLAPNIPGLIDLTTAHLSAASLTAPDRAVPLESQIGDGALTFNLADSDPLKGDYAQARFVLPATPTAGQTMLALVRSPYQQPSVAGRLRYEVLLNGTCLVYEDVALSNEINCIRATWTSTTPTTIEFRVRALRDCEPWTWGPSARLEILQLSHHESPTPTTTETRTTSRNATVIETTS